VWALNEREKDRNRKKKKKKGGRIASVGRNARKNVTFLSQRRRKTRLTSQKAEGGERKEAP